MESEASSLNDGIDARIPLTGERVHKVESFLRLLHCQERFWQEQCPNRILLQVPSTHRILVWKKLSRNCDPHSSERHNTKGLRAEEIGYK